MILPAALPALGYTYLGTEVMIWAIFALGYNLLLGYTGLPAFGHGAVWTTTVGLTLVGSYHPSRQNTNTGRLTPSMLEDVFRTARALAGLLPGRAA